MTKLTTMTNWHGILSCGALIGFLIDPCAGCGGGDTGSSTNTSSKTGAAGFALPNFGASGAGGGGDINNLINMFTMPMCEADASNVDSCGGVSCPAPSTDATMGGGLMGGLMGCTISCCTSDNRCGTRNADQRFAQIVGSMCTVPAVADPSCPSMNFGGMAIPGCCASTNQCGQLLGTMCLAGGFGGGFGGTPQAATTACGGDSSQ